MYGLVKTAIVHGIDGMIVTVEADVSDGLPVFEMVGFLSAEAREARERVRAALRNCGFSMPVKRVTVNISPASVRKTGTGFDLPTALAVLMASGHLPADVCEGVLVIGELQLSGRVQGVRGVLPMLLAARDAGIRRALIPADNEAEVHLVSGINVEMIRSLDECTQLLCGMPFPGGCPSVDEQMETEISVEKKPTAEVPEKAEPEEACWDFADIHGQERAKRACEIAAAGRHNLLMIGPPGSGKSMIARCVPGILPPMSERMRMELARIRSVCGVRMGDPADPPFRNPHHTISDVGMAGGGAVPHPGEISLSHGGVLFLDELPEFSRSALEILRQPLEEGEVRIVRQSGSYTFPADFMLIAAMNPCPCGYYPNRRRCRCTPQQVQRYLSRVSQPLLDRVDVSIDVTRMTFAELQASEKGESSAVIRGRVMAADETQRHRFADTPWRFNSQIPAGDMDRFIPLGSKEREHMEKRYEALEMTARGYHRMLRVARTIADLEGAARVEVRHLLEAELFRSADLRTDAWEY